MLAKLAAWAVVPVLLGLCGCDLEDFGGPRYNQDFHYSYPLKAGGRLSLETFNGGVELSVWDQDTVDVSGTKYGPSQSAADALRIDIVDTPSSVSIRMARPAEFRGGRGARFTVKMPRKTVLDQIGTTNGGIQVFGGAGPARLRTSNGGIRVEAVDGDIDLRTSNGSIDVTDVAGEVVAHTSNGRVRLENVRGGLQAGTSNGNITAIVAANQDVRPIRLDSSNGSIDLTLPANLTSGVRASTSNSGITLHMPGPVNARIVARTSNASVSSDFEVRMEGELNKNHMEGVMGNGGPLLDLSTSNGPIRFLRM
ncbi:MAG TPA: DUF4097 family beta strand repeat-containing protein [Bryobacteraceae bacterium]|jgi:hypothetical protein|nr:DUF4097 family beta strand repeat-containing protein [Bryobacteraceae bacterium]